MTRIRATSLDDLKFQQNDNPPTRAQKLELLRNLVLSISTVTEDGFPPHTHPISDVVALQDAIDALRLALFYRFGSFWISAPLSLETMMLHTVTDDITLYPNMVGSVGDIAGLPVADMVFTVWKNPTLTGETITGGIQIGTFTISTAGVFTFATTDQQPVRLYEGDVAGVRAPVTVQNTAKGGSFTFLALLGAIENYLALQGDMTDGDDVLLLKGDQNPTGLDLFTFAADQTFTTSTGASTTPSGFVGGVGPAGPAGPTGATGPEVSTYVHTQGSAAASWTVNHNKGNYPVADVLSVGGIVVDAEMEHSSVNQIIVRFAAPQTGSVVVR